MKFRLKKIGIDTHKESIAFVRRGHVICPCLGLHPMARVEISWGQKRILAVLQAVEEDFLDYQEIGLSEYAFEKFGVADGEGVEVTPAPPPASLGSIKKKITGGRLTPRDFQGIIGDIVEGRYSKVELTAFVVACTINKLDDMEVAHLTDAIVRGGRRLDFQGMVVDKHCIGGIPGNRTTMIVVPIVAAAGLTIPKTSSRAITSPAGTADTMEVLAEVEVPLERIYEIVKQEGGCIVWGGALDMAPADDVIITVEKPLNIDSEGQMIASILSKKAAAGSTHVVIDIPVGRTAKITSEKEGLKLKARFEKVAAQLGITAKVLLTDGSQPIGRGIGPVLEALDVLKVLQNKEDAPLDLKEKSVFLAGELIELSGKSKEGDGKEIARELLESGKALKKFEALRALQGERGAPALASNCFDVRAERGGRVTGIDNQGIARTAKLAGAPKDKDAGVYLFKKVGDHVKKGEPLFRIYANNSTTMSFARKHSEEEGVYEIR
jgi:thymidine phosphorylase